MNARDLAASKATVLGDCARAQLQKFERALRREQRGAASYFARSAYDLTRRAASKALDALGRER